MLPEKSHPLSQADLNRLDHFLHSASCGRDAMGLSRAHGFLTAAVSGPEGLAADEWIRLVFDEPVFATGEQAEEMLGLVMRLYRDIESGLRQSGTFRPVLEYVDDGAGSTRVDARLWCEGFISGMTLFREHWNAVAREVLREPLAVIFQLAQAPGFGGARQQALCEALPVAAEAVYLFWRAY
jgi:yecA family protein